MTKILDELTKRNTAYNERFYESGGVCPQKHLREFSSASPARTFVSPRLHKAATTLAAIGRRHCRKKVHFKRNKFSDASERLFPRFKFWQTEIC
jgi:hypothetical protein